MGESMDVRVDKVAEILVNYSTEVKPGDLVLIRLTDPLAEEMSLAVLKYVRTYATREQ
jgi:ribosomal protein S17